jgi:hypothetical protein
MALRADLRYEPALVRVALVYPPACDPTAPYLAVPTLTGFLRAHGVEVLPVDANVEVWDWLLTGERLASLAEKLERRLAALDALPALDHAAQREYLALWSARGDARSAPSRIDAARAVLKSEVDFYDAEKYEAAVETVESSMRLVSAAHAPLDVSFSAYRTPFALTSPEEIAHDADPERDPFDGWVTSVLAPRLSGVDVVGISVCFPGQLQPAYSFALKLRKLLPNVHLTCGGPGITQMMLRLSGADLARALGPFDSAVMFEGEAPLLDLLRALESKRPLREVANVVVRDALLGARWLPGHGSQDMRALPAPDFDGLPLDKYFAPHLTLPYDPTRGCYWGKCTFCHYGLAEVGTASYRERTVEKCVEHLVSLAEKYGTKYFYLSQDSVAPKTLVKLSEGLTAAGAGLRWATDLKAEKYLNDERAAILKAGGAVACAIGVESGNERVLSLIDKGAPVTVVREVMSRLARAGVAVEAMCFTDFPTETLDEGLDTVRLLDELRDDVALYIVGEFDLTEGALVAKDPARFGVAETYHLDGDLLKTGLFYEEKEPAKSVDDVEALDRAIADLGRGWKVRRYPWAGSLSTAHTVFYYDRFGPDVFRRLAELPPLAVGEVAESEARFDLDEVAASGAAESEIWHTLVRERRHVSRAAYHALAAELPVVAPHPRRWRFAAGLTPEPVRRGRRPSNRVNRAE